MSDPPQAEAPIQLQSMPMIRTVVSRKRFDSVPRKRARYILLYLTSFMLWVCHAFYYIILASEIEDPETLETAAAEAEETRFVPVTPMVDVPGEAFIFPIWVRVVRIFIAVCVGLFYVPFISVLRTMGYPWVGILAFCCFALAPIPGLLIVAYIDTRIAKAWNIADLRYQDSLATAGGNG